MSLGPWCVIRDELCVVSCAWNTVLGRLILGLTLIVSRGGSPNTKKGATKKAAPLLCSPGYGQGLASSYFYFFFFFFFLHFILPFLHLHLP